MSNEKPTEAEDAATPYHGHAGTQVCGDWCRHFDPLDQDLWAGYGRCVHPLSLRSGQVFRVGHECTVGEAPVK
ncbi:MAG: hypothetical protein ACAH89_12515 [Rariglobus sp.]|nr:hypothetical protein [Rariglobus sp.]